MFVDAPLQSLWHVPPSITAYLVKLVLDWGGPSLIFLLWLKFGRVLPFPRLALWGALSASNPTSPCPTLSGTCRTAWRHYLSNSIHLESPHLTCF